MRSKSRSRSFKVEISGKGLRDDFKTGRSGYSCSRSWGGIVTRGAILTQKFEALLSVKRILHVCECLLRLVRMPALTGANAYRDERICPSTAAAVRRHGAGDTDMPTHCVPVATHSRIEI
jgi:hypothetical protein